MIRRYKSTDKSKIIELFKQNTPEYFDHSEESDLENYLDNEVEDYFVYEEHFKIIGAGGINYFPEDNLARVSWDIIDPKSHGKGIGKKLTQHRINLLHKNPKIELIVVRTTQLVYKFYEKMGFELEKVETDYWAKNFDLYEMKMRTKS